MITLITPTGARPRQIHLCAIYMQAQTYKGDITWIIVDDCEPETSKLCLELKKTKNWDVKIVRPTPFWKTGDNTQARNLLAGLEEVKKLENVEAIFIIEDDDWYHPNYLSTMMNKLTGFTVAGEINTIYYNVRDYTIKRHRNTEHSSLFQICFTPEALPLFEHTVRRAKKFIDIEFFKVAKGVNLFSGLNLSIGIKGQEGRSGIGNGHRFNPTMARQKHTIAQCFALKGLIGVNYLNYIG